MTKTNFTFFHPMSWMKLQRSGILTLFLLFAFLLGSGTLSAQATPTIPNPHLPVLKEKLAAGHAVNKEMKTIYRQLEADPDLLLPGSQQAVDNYTTLLAFRKFVASGKSVQEALAFMNVPEVPDNLSGPQSVQDAGLMFLDWNNGNFNSYVTYMVNIIKE